VRRQVAGLLAAVVLTLGACTGSEPSTSDPPSARDACRVLAELTAVDATFRFDDAVQVRRDIAKSNELARRFVAEAPDEIRAEAVAQLRNLRRIRDVVADPAYSPSEADGRSWQTATSLENAEAIATWGHDACPATAFRDVPTSERVAFCLRHGATSDEVSALMDRTSAPSPSGRGIDLLDGITSVANAGYGIWIEFDARTTEARRNELLATLGAPPVVDVRHGEQQCP
jgi:hypothetical protein